MASEILELRRLLTTYYVATDNPAASDSNPGTSINAPLKTITQALDLAAADNGTQSNTILIGGGVYYEQPSVWAADSGVSSTDRTVISAETDPATGQYEPVYIDAADPTTGTWIQDGTSNIWYLNNFSTETAGVWVDWSPGNDGPSLQQIGAYPGETSADRVITGSGVADMYAGTYYGDLTTDQLYVWLADGSNPNQHTLEYAANSHVIYEPGTQVSGGAYSYASNLDFVGLNLRHANIYNTAGEDPGVGIYLEDNQRMIDCSVEWNTRDGVHLMGTQQLIDCTCDNNGGDAVSCKGSGFLISGGQYDYNFWRDYTDGSNAAIKVIGSPTLSGDIENAEIGWNHAKGIWFDTCYQSSVISDLTGNYIHDNDDAGIDLEASDDFLVANNIIVGNKADGISVNAVENADICNNTLVGNYGNATIELDGGTRTEPAASNGVVGMLDISIEDNIIANNFTVYDLDVPTLALVYDVPDEGNNTSDYNVFYRRGGPLLFTSGGTYLGGWGSTPSTLAGWQSASGQDMHSIVADPLFLVGGTGAAAYMLGSNSPARGAGANLSSLITTDYAGNNRPSSGPFDIGAYQYVSGPAGTPGPIIVDSNPSVWVDDQLPPGASMTAPDQSSNLGENRFWYWNSSNTYSGAAALDSTALSGAHRQYFTGADPRPVGLNDTLFAYVWIDPANLPSQIMFEWQDSGGSWSHQAYWGQNLIGPGVDGSEDAQYMGNLPAAGEWTLLSVPASAVGLAGKQITGFSFDLYNGRALLDELGNAPISSTPSISGTVFQDNNGNGVFDSGEPPLAGRTVFLDLNDSGVLQPGDPTAVTNASGAYAFYNLPYGTYTVDQIVPPGFVASTPGGSKATVSAGQPATLNFGEFPTSFSSLSNGDNFIVALSASQSTLEIWNGVSEASAPTYSIATPLVPQISFSAAATGSSLTVDCTNGVPLGSGAISFNGGSEAGGLSIIGSPDTQNSFVVNSGSVAINGDNIDFTSLGSLTIYGGAVSDTLTLQSNPAPVAFVGDGGADTLNVDAGNYTFAGDPVPAGGSLGVNVAPGASVTFAANPASSGIYDFHLAFLNISTGAVVTMNPSNGPPNRSLLILNSLTVGGQLNEGNGDVIIHNGNAAAINAGLAAGRHGGTWNGSSGITSSAAAADTTFLTAIGMALGISGQFDDQSVSASDVLLKYTYIGDANLNGVVDASDYSLIDNGYLHHLTGWYNGDFNYDGVVNGSDYTLIDNAFNSQGPSLSRQSTSILQKAVPIAPANPQPAAELWTDSTEDNSGKSAIPGVAPDLELKDGAFIPPPTHSVSPALSQIPMKIGYFAFSFIAVSGSPGHRGQVALVGNTTTGASAPGYQGVSPWSEALVSNTWSASSLAETSARTALNDE